MWWDFGVKNLSRFSFNHYDYQEVYCFINTLCYSQEWGTQFNVQWLLGQDIQGSTVGIVGFGGIGQTIAKRLLAFEVGKILYCGHKRKPEGK